MAFQKYQGEQVQQIPAGYVEAMGSMGKAYQQVGASVSAGLQEADKRAQEEAKLQGSLAPYLRSDGRTQAVESALSTGLLKKDEKGNVIIPDENKSRFDMNVAGPAIEFYNKTGGDGSKLTGSDLTRFATQFEAQRKYDAERASIADKEMERAKTQAEINKLNAEAAEKAAGAVGNNIVSAFASGAPIPAAVPASVPAIKAPVTTAQQNTVSLYSKQPGSELPSISTPDFSTTPGFTKPMTGFGVDRYNAGLELSSTLGKAPAEAPKPAHPAYDVRTTDTLPKPTDVTVGTKQLPIPELVAQIDAERTVQTTAYNNKKAAAQADYARAMSALAASGGATPERIKALNETQKVKTDNIETQYKANIDLIEGRLKAATTVTAEARATDEALMKKEQFGIQYGTPVAQAPTPASANLKPGTFAQAQAVEREQASTVPGRTGGTFSREQEEKVAAEQEKKKSEFPANWGIGVFHEGAKQYQFDLSRHPTARPLGAAAQGKVDEHMAGYSEAQTYLTSLNDVVNSTDDNAITNYLNRSLWTAQESAKGTNITGEMLNQFGVAAFRRAIVSGGNFSDEDRKFVAKLITDINSAHVKKDKALMVEQTKALAKFIDSKYRAELTGYGVRVDTKTAREFLTREGDQAGLEQLAKTEQYMRTFGLGSGGTASSRPDYIETLIAVRDKADAAGNAPVVKQLDSQIAELKRKAVETAKKNANK